MPFTILYVEDNELSADLMREIVAIVPDIELLAAATGEDGLNLALMHKPDLIFLDVRLPHMTGYDVLTRLRAAPETIGIPVIALSADAMPRDVSRGQAAGFLQYITKPLSVPQILHVIDRVRTSASV